MTNTNAPEDSSRGLRWPEWPLLVTAALAGLSALTLITFATQSPHASSNQRIAINVPASANAVALTDSAGHPTTWGDLRGVPRAVFFGFTRCPEICPTTVADLSAALDRLGPDAKYLRIDFVSLDPTRDTPQLLHDYFSSFGPRFHGYTGTEANIAALARDFQVFYEHVPTTGGDYTLNHTAIVYLLNASGEVVDIMGYQTPARPCRRTATPAVVVRAK